MTAGTEPSDVSDEVRLLIDGALVPATGDATFDNVSLTTDVPFGGDEQRGIGRGMGRAGFEECIGTTSTAEPE